jgi:hypothetical protein
LRHTEEGAEIIAEEYFSVDGIRTPKRFRMRTYGVPMTIEVREIRFNQVIPDSMLALPAEIARLAKKRWTAPSPAVASRQ